MAGLQDFFGVGVDTVVPADSQRLRLSGKGTRIPLTGIPFEIEMGRQRVQLYPDLPVNDGSSKKAFDYILFDPQRYFSGISHFLRLRRGHKVAVDRNDEKQKCLFSSPRDAFRRHLQITHEGDALVFRDPISELGTYVSIIGDTEKAVRITIRRRQALQHLGEIFGGPIKLLPSEQALDTLQQVNELLRKEPYRPLDSYGNAGGLLNLPEHLTPIVVGDLHAQFENLLKLLSENMYLEALEKGDAALIFLGDVVHPEDEKELSFMDSSILIMDIIFKLKLRFPNNVFMILGNHDSFSLDVMKGGIPQGLLWERRIIATRGEAYRDALELFYRQLPLVVKSEHFVACHAGPPRSTPSREMLVDVRRYPNLFRELTWTRVKTPRFPAGYTRGDVRRFRKALGVSENIPFIVAHYPLSRNDTIWLNVRGIPRHHIVFSALPEQVGVFTRIDDEMVAQIYPAEGLSQWINQTLRDP
ncbi:MAG: metallophosphoesterase [Pseudomonadota bacterium]